MTMKLTFIKANYLLVYFGIKITYNSLSNFKEVNL